MKYASVCSGVEAASLAWMPLGWQAAWFSEIEPFSCAVLKERYPNVPNLGDMTKIRVENLQNGDQKYYGADGTNVIVSGGVDLLVGGTPCFPAGTLVLTPDGYKPIDTLKIGDEVVSHSGNVCKVSATGSKIAPVGKLKIIGRPEISCTANHPFLTIDVKRDRRRKSETYSQTIPAGEWDFTAAEHSVGKYAGRLEVKQTDYCVPSTILSEEDLLELAGWYVGDGYIRTFKGKTKKAIILALVSKKKIKTFQERFEQKINFCIGADGKVTIYNTKIAEFLIENFGHLSSGKKIPYWLYSRESLKKSFLFGLEMTDGCHKGNGCNVTTISEPLAYGIADLYGNASVRVQKVETETKIQGRTVNQHDYYVVSKISTKAVKTKFINGRYASRVKEFKDENGTIGTVFNITVSGDHTYIVNGVAVHNCQGFSVAGKQGGLNDDRSVLCLTYIKLLETMRPRWFVWENVPGVFSTNEGDDFKEFIRQIDEIGYHVAWRVLDAQYVRVDGFPRAVPQRRRRVFVVGHLGGWQYPAEVLFEQNCLFRDTPPCRVKGKGFTTDVKRCVGATSTVRMRAGCEGGGKGAFVSKELSLTLAAAGNDQVLFYNTINEQYASSSHGCFAKSAVAGTLKANGGDIGGGSENLATIMNQNQVAATLDTHYGDKQGLEDQHVNAGCPNFVIEKHEQIVCVNGAETPINNSDGYANPVTANHNGLENVIACNSKKMGLDIGFDVNATLNATNYKEPQIICYENHANDSRIKNMGDVCQTLSLLCGTGGGNLPLVQSVFVKTAKPTQKGDCETYKDTGVAPTLNTFDQGDKRANELVVNCYNGSNRITNNNTAPVFYNWHSQSVSASKIEDDVSPTIPAAMGMGGTNMTTPVFIQDTIAIAENVINRKPENGGNGIGAQQEISYTLNSTGVMGVCYGVDVYNQQITGDVAGTLTSASGEPNTSGPKVMSRATVRRLLPVECERLMGFPDNHTKIPWKGKPTEECPDAPRYKACGNSMCVNVMRWIGLRIEMVERKTKQ